MSDLKHLGVIMDGNRRWAKKRGFPPMEGHRKGSEVTKKIIKWSRQRGIKVLTLYAFSVENWKRAKREVSFLMKFARKFIRDKEFESLAKNGIRIKIIGDRERLPKELRKDIEDIEKKTEKNKEMLLNIALSYGGRLEIAEAAKKAAKKGKVNEKTISENLWVPDLDLLIRTGKEQRISNFLIWQAAYSELYFSDKYWPEFSEADLDKALSEYHDRKRRFGK